MKEKSTAISDTQSINIANRLKILREEKGISHERLSRATGISKDTLIKYEKTYLGANKGMSVSFAVVLANYYGTSTDYILCRTDIRSPDVTMSDICNKTGLSETAINNLTHLNKMNNGENIAIYRCLQAITALLEKNSGIDILGSIGDYLYNIHEDGYEEYEDGSRRILHAEDLNNADLYLNIMPQLRDFQKEIAEESNNVSI